MSDTYSQVLLDGESQRLTTIDIHKVFFMYSRLCFGISSSPGVFQRIIDPVIQGIAKTVAYLDNILISGQTMEEHYSNLRAVFKRLLDAGPRLRGDKCKLKRSSIPYLDHKIDAGGIHPTLEKVHAIRKAPTPKNLSELHIFFFLLL